MALEDQEQPSLDAESARLRAEALWRRAHEYQMQHDFDEAVRLYKFSIEVYPTAEAHTFLGWTYSWMERAEDAIQECLNAILVDPSFGNPYNDIGSYLIQLDRQDEAIPWLRKAMVAERYECYFYPHQNLARIFENKARWEDAIHEYRAAIREYLTASRAASDERQATHLLQSTFPLYCQIAQILVRLGKWPEAVQTYQEALPAAPKEEYVGQVEQAIDQLISRWN